MKRILTLLAFVSTSAYAQLITLNSGTLYQTMHGWEATDQAGQVDAATFNTYKNALFDAAANDLGINRLRVEIKSGTENSVDYYAQYLAGQITESQYNAHRYEIINDNADANSINPNGFKWSKLDYDMNTVVLPMRQRLAARGEYLWVNVNYVDFDQQSTFKHKNFPAEYAEFVLATYQHMQSTFGFVPDSWEVVLEPDNSQWNATQFASVIKPAGDKLVANGFTPNFIAPSGTTSNIVPPFIEQIAQTPGAMQYISEFSYHRYDVGTNATLQAIANLGILHNKRTAMLEWIGADYNALHQDIKFGRVSSWQQFTLAYPGINNSGGKYYEIDDSNGTFVMGSRTKFLRQYFKYIRRGAVCYSATSNAGNLDALAFRNTDSTHVTVVKATSGGAVNIAGLPAGTYGIFYTTSSAYNQQLGDQTITSGQQVSTNIPAAGVITIYGKSATPTGIASLETSTEVLVYPNPSNGDVKFIFNNNNEGSKSLAIYDIAGKLITRYTDIKNTELTLPKGKLSSGIYTYKVLQGSKLISSNKLVIQ